MSIRFFLKKNKFYNTVRSSIISVLLRKRNMVGLVFAICSNLVVMPVLAASTGMDTLIWKMIIALMELIVLGVLLQIVISDVIVLRWFENKKRIEMEYRFYRYCYYCTCFIKNRVPSTQNR